MFLFNFISIRYNVSIPSDGWARQLHSRTTITPTSATSLRNVIIFHKNSKTPLIGENAALRCWVECRL